MPRNKPHNSQELPGGNQCGARPSVWEQTLDAGNKHMLGQENARFTATGNPGISKQNCSWEFSQIRKHYAILASPASVHFLLERKAISRPWELLQN